MRACIFAWIQLRPLILLPSALTSPAFFSRQVVHKPESLLEFLARKLRVQGGGRGLRLESLKKANHEVKKFTWKVTSKHQKSGRPYKLRGIDNVPISESMFYDDEKQRERSVLEYMQEKYPNVRIERLDLPCVEVGPKKDPHKIRLPLEWMALDSFQPATITPELQADMIKETCAEPNPRFQLVSRVKQSLLQDSGAALKEIGIEMKQEFVTTQARQLPPAKLVYADSRTGAEIEVRPRPNLCAAPPFPRPRPRPR